MTDDIVTFIRARLQEDQDIAKGAAYVHGAPWAVVPDEVAYLYTASSETDHISRHDPARVLRGVEAKRRLIDKVMNWEHKRLYDALDENVGPYPCCRDGVTCECGVLDQQLDVLRAVASEWSAS